MISPSRRLCTIAAAMLVAAGAVESPAADAAAPQLIAFTAALSGPFNPGGIFVMRPDGSDVRQLTSFGFIDEESLLARPTKPLTSFTTSDTDI